MPLFKGVPASCHKAKAIKKNIQHKDLSLSGRGWLQRWVLEPLSQAVKSWGHR